jgi:hypothetical protein
LCECREAGTERTPRVSAIRRAIEAAVRAGEIAVLPGTLASLPEDGVDILWIARVKGEVDCAGVLILIENLLKRLAAIEGAEDAALGVGSVGMAEGGDEEAVRIAGVDQDRRDLLRVAEAKMTPGFPPSMLL